MQTKQEIFDLYAQNGLAVDETAYKAGASTYSIRLEGEEEVISTLRSEHELNIFITGYIYGRLNG